MAATKNCSVCDAPLTARQRKHCSKACKAKVYYQANRERLRARENAYREANREKVKAYNKAYREANREKIAAQNKAYQEARIEEIKAYNKAYREANREKIAAQNKAYRRAHPEECLRQQAKRFFGVPNPPEELIQAKIQQLKILRLIKDKDRVGKPAG